MTKESENIALKDFLQAQDRLRWQELIKYDPKKDDRTLNEYEQKLASFLITRPAGFWTFPSRLERAYRLLDQLEGLNCFEAADILDKAKEILSFRSIVSGRPTE